MAVTIADVMRYCNNFFERELLEGDFAISGDGVLSPAVDAPYIAITGSAYHDGVYARGETLTGPGEEFSGKVWLLSPPRHFIEMCKDIAAYDTAHPAGAPVSESFGGYSYAKRHGAEVWTGAYAMALRGYMRMFTEVSV